MAEQLQPLVRIGPFGGLNYSESGELITAEGEQTPTNRGVTASNADPQRKTGTLLPELGRVNITDLTPYMATITSVLICVTAGDRPLYLVQGTTAGSALVSVYYDPFTSAVLTITGLTVFDEAVQFGSVVYTNGGQRLFLDVYPSVANMRLQAYTWQYTVNNNVGQLNLSATTPVALSIVQSTTFNGTSVTLGSPPTNGNILVVMAASSNANAGQNFMAVDSVGQQLTQNTWAQQANAGNVVDAASSIQSYRIEASPTGHYTFSATATGAIVEVNQTIKTADSESIGEGAGIAQAATSVMTGQIGAVSPFPASGLFFAAIGVSTGTPNLASLSGNNMTSFGDVASSSWRYANAGQITSPAATFGNSTPADLALTAVGLEAQGLAPGTYFYVTTETTTMPDGSISETSVNPDQYANPPSITIASTSSIVVALNAGFTFIGTNSDGTSWATNLYRQSSNQAGYFLVSTLTTNASYIDAAPDASIEQNQALTVHRDPPPTVGGGNPGALGLHKNRMWVFVVVDNDLTENIPQTQLWYSNLDRAWEFDDTTQVLLMESDIVTTPTSSPIVYTGLYGNEPRQVGSVGTILVALKQREFWAVYGDDPSSFIQRPLFGIGAVSRHGGCSFNGGWGWITEGGPYFFDGSAPAFTTDKIKDYLQPIPGPGIMGTVGVPPAAQASAAAVFHDLTWVLAFPPLESVAWAGQSITYDTVSGEWLSTLPYYPNTPSAIDFARTQPNQVTGGGNVWGAVVVGRGAFLDWWFADLNNDLGTPTVYSWQGPFTESKMPGSQKIYRFLTLHVPPKSQGAATVTLQVDTQDPFVWEIDDLSTATRHIKTMSISDESGGMMRGYMAHLSVSVQGVAGEPAPHIRRIICWGTVPPDRTLNPPT